MGVCGIVSRLVRRLVSRLVRRLVSRLVSFCRSKSFIIIVYYSVVIAICIVVIRSHCCKVCSTSSKDSSHFDRDRLRLERLKALQRSSHKYSGANFKLCASTTSAWFSFSLSSVINIDNATTSTLPFQLLIHPLLQTLQQWILITTIQIAIRTL